MWHRIRSSCTLSRVISYDCRRLLDTYVRGGRKVTRLPNGTRVVSWGGTRALSAVGVFMILGTRSESDETNGCSAIYDRYLFSSNRKISRDVLAEDFAHLGNSIAVSNHRECVSYIAQCPSYYVPQAVDVLSGALLFPTSTTRRCLPL